MTPEEIKKTNASIAAGTDPLTSQRAVSLFSEESSLIEATLEGMAIAEKAQRAKIPENVFREIFLPYFTGQLKANADAPAFENWAGLVGGFSSEADVVDPKGNVLFVVPALYFTEDVVGVDPKKTDLTFNKLVVDYTTDAPNLPQDIVENRFNQGISILIAEAIQTGDKETGWEKVFDYYNIDPAGNPLPPKNAAGQTKVYSTFDDSNFVEE